MVDSKKENGKTYTYFEFFQKFFPRDWARMQSDPGKYELEEAIKVVEQHRIKEMSKPMKTVVKGSGRQTMRR